MATAQTSELVQYCNVCGKRLIKATTANGTIGSPLIKCRHCATVQVTSLRTEWYKYEAKAMLWIFPILMPLMLYGIGWFFFDSASGAFAAMIGLFIGLWCSFWMLVRMLLSKKRMRNPEYLKQLLEYEAITKEEYMLFMEQAK